MQLLYWYKSIRDGTILLHSQCFYFWYSMPIEVLNLYSFLSSSMWVKNLTTSLSAVMDDREPWILFSQLICQWWISLLVQSVAAQKKNQSQLHSHVVNVYVTKVDRIVMNTTPLHFLCTLWADTVLHESTEQYYSSEWDMSQLKFWISPDQCLPIELGAMHSEAQSDCIFKSN